MIDAGDEYYSVGECEDELFDEKTAEGGSYSRLNRKKDAFTCIITENRSFVEKQQESEQVSNQLMLVGVVCGIFMVVEFIGGALSNSSAIMTDAAHMLSDVSAIAVSVFAIRVAGRPASIVNTYGYHRAEILGALTSIIIIWILVAWLCYEATWRMYACIYGNGFYLDS